MTYLVTAFGRPFTANGFGNKFRDWCNEAGLPHCAAHGLRKAGATIASDNGATTSELMAIYGWESILCVPSDQNGAGRNQCDAQPIYAGEPFTKENDTEPRQGSSGEILPSASASSSLPHPDGIATATFALGSGLPSKDT